MKKISKILILCLFSICIYYVSNNIDNSSYGYTNVYEYEGREYIYINDNVPEFESDLINTNTFESYSDLDSLGRCGVALANISKELMPTTERGSIGNIKPSGWKQAKYDIVDGKYLYNRCHLIGYQLTSENDNEKNLVTCTRQMNTGIMLDIENEVSAYIKQTNNHVLYRVTPYYLNDNLLISGVQLEALSIEDNGEGIKYNVFIYNVQDGVTIDYTDGTSYLE